MKRLLEYINEQLDLMNKNVKAKDILVKLSKTDQLPSYVKKLNMMLKDKDCESILNKAFGDYKGDDGYDFDGEMMELSVKNLHPTQNEIDVNKSLGFPFDNTDNAKKNMGQDFADSDSPLVKMPFPLITFGEGDEKYIIDGHHRWSQVFAFNPYAKMECFHLSVKGGNEKLSANDVLKICQGFIAAKAASIKKKELGSAKAGEVNALTDDKNKILEKVNSYCEKNEDAAKIIRSAISKYYEDREKQFKTIMDAAKVKDENQKKIKDSLDEEKDFDGLAAYLSANLLVLQRMNTKYVKMARDNSRKVMPQTDTGGDNPKDSKTALPDKEGSALNNMVNGKVDPKVVKK